MHAQSREWRTQAVALPAALFLRNSSLALTGWAVQQRRAQVRLEEQPTSQRRVRKPGPAACRAPMRNSQLRSVLTGHELCVHGCTAALILPAPWRRCGPQPGLSKAQPPPPCLTAGGSQAAQPPVHGAAPPPIPSAGPAPQSRALPAWGSGRRRPPAPDSPQLREIGRRGETPTEEGMNTLMLARPTCRLRHGRQRMRWSRPKPKMQVGTHPSGSRPAGCQGPSHPAARPPAGQFGRCVPHASSWCMHGRPCRHMLAWRHVLLGMCAMWHVLLGMCAATPCRTLVHLCQLRHHLVADAVQLAHCGEVYGRGKLTCTGAQSSGAQCRPDLRYCSHRLEVPAR